MIKKRSPQFPVVGLAEAIDKTRLVWEQDYTSDLPRDVIAEHMGYSSLNGKSLGIIAAVAKYGLLDGRGDETHVTELAVQILAHEKGDPQRIEAVIKAASLPKLFQDINEKFDGRSPSDQALKSYLFTRGFTHTGVEGLIRSFRDTETFVQEETLDYPTNEVADTSEEEMQTREEIQTLTPPPPYSPPPAAALGVPTISMSDSGLEISGGVISSLDQFEKLMRRLKAGRAMLDEDDGSDLI